MDEHALSNAFCNRVARTDISSGIIMVGFCIFQFFLMLCLKGSEGNAARVKIDLELGEARWKAGEDYSALLRRLPPAYPPAAPGTSNSAVPTSFQTPTATVTQSAFGSGSALAPSGPIKQGSS
ncbi:hypothetical protein SEVIR_3G133875v4 [Setaria viridis]